MVRELAAAVAVAIAGCSAPQEVIVPRPVEIKVPYPVRAHPPAELMEFPAPPAIRWVAPTDPAASSALTIEGETALTTYIETLIRLHHAWRVWAICPGCE